MNSIQEELYSKPSERLVKHSFLTFMKIYELSLYVVVRFFLLFSHQSVRLIHLVIFLLNQWLNDF
ncbi:hypothetical protein Godav_023469 [Gossypium davidsonii]|uniref:Uncharacterized protein n=1 Tax=Gossypium davidsonii TaxID=34287 RepID=A0A7J8STF6_GOSDV|nr:hypothetical protein [Gossypium davidsonii]